MLCDFSLTVALTNYEEFQTSSTAYKRTYSLNTLKIKLTEIRAYAGNAPHCYTCISSISAQRLRFPIEVLRFKDSPLPPPKEKHDQNAECPLKRNWMKLVLGLDIHLPILMRSIVQVY
jgi:hypothetical protein